MTTVSSVSTNPYGYSTSLTGASGAAGQKSARAVAQTDMAALQGTLASLGGSNSSSPLTYNAAGLLNAFQQAKSGNLTTSTTSVQQAQAAVLAAETVVTETLASLLTAGSAKDASGSTGSDISALFSLPGTAQAIAPFALSPSASRTGVSGAQTAQDSFFAVENAITNTLGALGADMSSNSSVAGR